MIAVIGRSSLRQPDEGHAYVAAELDIEIVLLPGAGELKASAVLAPGSYVITEDAHLTGGFAFSAWFGDNPHAGDFALTLGGYHPAFAAPSHYPQEPRLGINWAVGGGITVTGEAYFALTPSAGMAGGKLSVTLDAGPLQAWLTAQVDAFVRWKPFYFTAGAHVSVGVSFTIDLLLTSVTLSVEIGAGLDLFGPPVGFRVHVDWHIISFTIEHGDESPPDPLTWPDVRAMLPVAKQAQSEARTARPAPEPAAQSLVMAAAAPAPASDADTLPEAAWLYIRPVGGLSQSRSLDKFDHWLMRAGDFQVAIGSAVPCSSITLEDYPGAKNATVTGEPLAIRPLGIAASACSTLRISVLALKQESTDSDATAAMVDESSSSPRPSGCTLPTVGPADWTITALIHNVPQGLWGTPLPAGQDPQPNADTQTVQHTTGVTLTPQPPAITNATPEMEIDVLFRDRIINPGDDAHRLPIAPDQSVAGAAPVATGTFTAIAASATDPAVAAARDGLFHALVALGAYAGAHGPDRPRRPSSSTSLSPARFFRRRHDRRPAEPRRSRVPAVLRQLGAAAGSRRLRHQRGPGARAGRHSARREPRDLAGVLDSGPALLAPARGRLLELPAARSRWRV